MEFSIRGASLYICTEREGKAIPGRFKKKNVVVIPYDDIATYTPEDVPRAVDRVINALKHRVPPCIRLRRAAAIRRVRKMNQVAEKLNNHSFKRVNKFYHIHGSHRIHTTE